MKGWEEGGPTCEREKGETGFWPGPSRLLPKRNLVGTGFANKRGEVGTEKKGSLFWYHRDRNVLEKTRGDQEKRDLVTH